MNPSINETIEQWLSRVLVDHGLWPDEATAVIAEIRQQKATEPLAAVLGKNAAGYPAPFHAVALMTAKSIAVEWIDENKPQHFARMILAS